MEPHCVCYRLVNSIITIWNEQLKIYGLTVQPALRALEKNFELDLWASHRYILFIVQ